MPYYEGKDIKLFYEDIGAGEPVIFLHSSISRGIISFSAQIMEFQAQFRCLLPDLRGFGRTSADLDWEMPQLADDIINLMDELKLDKAHIVGFSLGGDVGLYCAVKYPERVKSLIVIGVTGFINSKFLKFAKAFEYQLTKEKFKKTYIDLLMANHYEAHKGDWKKFLERTIYNWRTYPDFTDEDLSGIKCPCLFIAGEKDDIVLDEEINKLRLLIKDFRTEKIQGCGHGPHLVSEKPVEMNKMMLDFIRKARFYKKGI